MAVAQSSEHVASVRVKGEVSCAFLQLHEPLSTAMYQALTTVGKNLLVVGEQPPTFGARCVR